ncbi:MAG: hypothetical protein IH934_03130 [Nanoarchaeota archaeon]|nr:hypothetical protein [Nanoarchaeota archaeon]
MTRHYFNAPGGAYSAMLLVRPKYDIDTLIATGLEGILSFNRTPLPVGRTVNRIWSGRAIKEGGPPTDICISGI